MSVVPRWSISVGRVVVLGLRGWAVGTKGAVNGVRCGAGVSSGGGFAGQVEGRVRMEGGGEVVRHTTLSLALVLRLHQRVLLVIDPAAWWH